MKTRNLLPFIFTICLFVNLNAQSVKYNKKELSFLNSAKVVLVEFDYSQLTFEDNKSEADYLEHRVKRLNERVNSDSIGYKWLNQYKVYKSKKWQEKFVNELNKRLAKAKKKVVFTLNAEDADYKLVVKTNWIYLGYNVGVANEPAKIKVDFDFYDIESPETLLTSLHVKRATGTNGNSIKKGDKFQYLMRVGNAYKKSAFMIYVVLNKFLN